MLDKITSYLSNDHYLYIILFSYTFISTYVSFFFVIKVLESPIATDLKKFPLKNHPRDNGDFLFTSDPRD